MSDTGVGTQRATIQDAAKSLGVSESAIRKRINRGTLRHEKDARNGRMYVFLEGMSEPSDTHSKDTSDTVSDMMNPTVDSDLLAAKDETIIEMRDRISSLERQLDARTEELRRRDIIISQITARIPELENSATVDETSAHSPSEAETEAPESPESRQQKSASTTEESEAATEPHSAADEYTEVRKPWWRRLLGG